LEPFGTYTIKGTKQQEAGLFWWHARFFHQRGLSKKKTAIAHEHLPLLPQRIPLLLGLQVRFSYLPSVHGRKSVGHVM
jgi:hypothetical protein